MEGNASESISEDAVESDQKEGKAYTLQMEESRY